MTVRCVVWQLTAIEARRSTNVLLIRLSSLGDVLHTLPAVNAVRESLPEARLVYLVSQHCAAMLGGFPAVDEILVLDRKAFRRILAQAWWANTFGLVARLRRLRFDLAIDFHGFGETALLTRLSGARRRWGLVEDNKLRRLAYTQVVPRAHDSHRIEQHLSLLRACGMTVGDVRNEFHLPVTYRDRAAQRFREWGFTPNHPTIFIQPFSSDPQRDVPLTKLLALARHWKGKGVQVLFGGGPADRDRLKPVLGDEFPTSAGAELLLTAGLIQQSSLVLGSDSCAVHLAVALGKRVVMWLRTLSPKSQIPYRHPEWVLTPPAGQRIEDIATAQLIQACESALGVSPHY